MNARSHYRNSTLAFPKTAEYGCAIERPVKHYADRCVAIALAGAVIFLIVLITLENMK